MNINIGLLNLTPAVNRKVLLGIIGMSALSAIMGTIFRLMQVEMQTGQLADGSFGPVEGREDCHLGTLPMKKIFRKP